MDLLEYRFNETNKKIITDVNDRSKSIEANVHNTTYNQIKNNKR